MPSYRAYWGHSDILTGPIRSPLFVAAPGTCVVRYDATHLLRPTEAQLKAEAARKKQREDLETKGWRG